MRVLIVEDQADIGCLMSKMVGFSGHQVTLAADGLAAIQMAGELPPELVLLDINMPGIDGYETARRLRLRHGRQFPIYAVTAAPVDMALAGKCGFDGIFSKAFAMDSLTKVMGQFSADSG